jgi:cephalosporin hydroxylase
MIRRQEEMKMISVIIPALNSWENVIAAVELARRDPSVGEIIVVDDGSVDQMIEFEDPAPVKLTPSTVPGKGASPDRH